MTPQFALGYDAGAFYQQSLSHMTRVDPNLWQTPEWHTDWDGEFQFSALRGFARVLHAGTDLDARLAIIETGYARLEVFDGVRRIGMAYANRADDASLPSFTVYAGATDDELTTTDIAAALRFLDQRRTAFPENVG